MQLQETEAALLAFAKEALQSGTAAAVSWSHPTPAYMALAQAHLHAPVLQQLLQEESRSEAAAEELPLLQQLMCSVEPGGSSVQMLQFHSELNK